MYQLFRPLRLRHHPPLFYHTLKHTNVHVDQPFVAIPDQIHILQSCWGRSAQHHSQGTPTSLYWPPWRSTPPSSPPELTRRTLIPTTTTTPTRHQPGQTSTRRTRSNGHVRLQRLETHAELKKDEGDPISFHRVSLFTIHFDHYSLRSPSRDVIVILQR